MTTPVTEEMRTLTTTGQSLLRWDHLLSNIVATRPGDSFGINVDNVLFRMLEPHEIGRGMAFADDYVVVGGKREGVRQYGNAVTPPVAELIVSALVETITGEQLERRQTRADESLGMERGCGEAPCHPLSLLDGQLIAEGGIMTPMYVRPEDLRAVLEVARTVDDLTPHEELAIERLAEALQAHEVSVEQSPGQKRDDDNGYGYEPSDMDRTPIPKRTDIKHLRALIRQKREEGLATIALMLDDVDSLIIEAELFRNKYDSASRRQRDGARARKPIPPKITIENADRYDDPTGGP